MKADPLQELKGAPGHKANHSSNTADFMPLQLQSQSYSPSKSPQRPRDAYETRENIYIHNNSSDLCYCCQQNQCQQKIQIFEDQVHHLAQQLKDLTEKTPSAGLEDEYGYEDKSAKPDFDSTSVQK